MPVLRASVFMFVYRLGAQLLPFVILVYCLGKYWEHLVYPCSSFSKDSQRIGDTLATLVGHWRRIGNVLGTHWRHLFVIDDALVTDWQTIGARIWSWARNGKLMGTTWATLLGTGEVMATPE